MNRNIQYVISVMVMWLGSLCSFASDVTIKASLDSAYIIMGKQTTLHVEIIDDIKVNGIMPINDESIDTIISQIEIISRQKPDTIDLGSNRRQINQDIIIQSFDSGLYTIPPILYKVKDDSFFSNSLILKVIPVQVDSLPTIHNQANVIAPNYHWYDYLPDFLVDNWWWLLLALSVTIGCLGAIFMHKKKIVIPLIPQKKPIPPYELAMQQLTALREEKLCDKGHEKEYYTRLIDILRIYIDARFGINAKEMTSTQIIEALNDNVETKLPNKYMKQILSIADFVKFAKVRPLPDDNIKAHSLATQFVEDTRPIEQAESSDDNRNTPIEITETNK